MTIDGMRVIENVGEDLYGKDMIPLSVRPDPNARIYPTIIQEFSGVVRTLHKGSDGIVRTEHDSVGDALKFITETFGIDIPIIKFEKGLGQENGKEKTKP